MWEVLLEALIDSLKTLQFLFLIYVLMEVIESVDKKNRIKNLLKGKHAPLFAGLIGVFPQCGFSLMGAKIYNKKLIRTGTLLALFLSASDEGLAVLISNGVDVKTILLFIGVKFVYAVIVGYILNALFFKKDLIEEGEIQAKPCHEKKDDFWFDFVLHPLLHTLKIFAFILVVNVLFNVFFFLLKEENVSAFISGYPVLQIILSSLIGLIPNCSASVIIAQTYTIGSLSFSGLVAGLSANAGVALAILLKNKERVKNNLLIVLLLYLLSVALGFIVLPLGAVLA